MVTFNQYYAFYVESTRRKCVRWFWLALRLCEAEGGEKERKKRRKKGPSEGFEGRIWIKFLNCPDPRKLRGVDGESISPVIYSGVIIRLLINCYFQCVWEHHRPDRRKSAWSCVSYRGNGVDVFFSLDFFYSRLFFSLFFIFSQRDEQRVRNGGVGSKDVCVYQVAS